MNDKSRPSWDSPVISYEIVIRRHAPHSTESVELDSNNLLHNLIKDVSKIAEQYGWLKPGTVFSLAPNDDTE